MIGTYDLRPGTVEAVQWDGTQTLADEIAQWTGLAVLVVASNSTPTLLVHAASMDVYVRPSDYVVKDGTEVFACPQSVFDRDYQPVAAA